MKVAYTIERVKQFVSNPLTCYKCQKYGHHENACRGREVCGKCGKKKPDHHMNECEFLNKCAVVVAIKSTQDPAKAGEEKRIFSQEN